MSTDTALRYGDRFRVAADVAHIGGHPGRILGSSLILTPLGIVRRYQVRLDHFPAGTEFVVWEHEVREEHHA